MLKLEPCLHSSEFMDNSFPIWINVDSLNSSLCPERKKFMASLKHTKQQLELDKIIATKTSSTEICGNKEWDRGMEIPKEKISKF